MLLIAVVTPATRRAPRARTCARTWQEYAELPVRHNEDVLNGELSKKLPWAVGTEELDSPHAKAHLLLQVRAIKETRGYCDELL